MDTNTTQQQIDVVGEVSEVSREASSTERSRDEAQGQRVAEEALVSMAERSLVVLDPTPGRTESGSTTVGSTGPQGKSKKKKRCGADKKRARNAKLAAEAASQQNQDGSQATQERPTEGGPVTGQPYTGGRHNYSTPGASAGLDRKRSRPSDSTPPEKYSNPKRPAYGPRSYGEVAREGGKRVIIAPTDYPEVTLSSGQGDLVVQTLCGAMDSIPEEEVLPRFEQYRCDQGVLWVTCTDEGALTWLRTTVPILTPWADASLQLLEQGQLPRLTRMMTFIHGIPEETEVILRRLRRQNPGLQTNLWRVWGRNDTPADVHLVVGVDMKSREVLKKQGHMAHYSLGKILFREGHPRADRSRESQNPGDPVENTPQQEAQEPATATGPQRDVTTEVTEMEVVQEVNAVQGTAGSGRKPREPGLGQLWGSERRPREPGLGGPRGPGRKPREPGPV